MSELLPLNADIIMANLKGDIKITNIEGLLPYAFNSDDLK